MRRNPSHGLRCAKIQSDGVDLTVRCSAQTRPRASLLAGTDAAATATAAGTHTHRFSGCLSVSLSVSVLLSDRVPLTSVSSSFGAIACPDTQLHKTRE